MQNENQENLNQSGNIKKNPSRDNRNINQGQNDEKKFDAENESNRDVEINHSEQLDRKEIDLDRSGISTSQDRQTREFGGGKESGQGQENIQQAGKQNVQGVDQNKNQNMNKDVNQSQKNSKLQ
jgi:hypothetical protein